MMSHDLIIALPEVFLAVAGMVLLMVGVFHRGKATKPVMLLAILTVAVALALVWIVPRQAATAFGGLFVVDSFDADFMETLILLGALLVMIMSLRYIEREGMARFEFPVLMVYATLGMLMMVSANDLISLYLGLELQSLSLYVMAAFRKDTLRSTEAGLKYFVLGALSSGMLLYGSSMIYGFLGHHELRRAGRGLQRRHPGRRGGRPSASIVGLVFVLAGFAFKVSAVPFHMWTPDVYEGAPTAVTAFFANAPKVAAMALTVRVMMGPFGDLIGEWQQIIVADLRFSGLHAARRLRRHQPDATSSA